MAGTVQCCATVTTSLALPGLAREGCAYSSESRLTLVVESRGGGQVTEGEQLNGRWRLVLPPETTGREEPFETWFDVHGDQYRTHDGCNELFGSLDLVDGRLCIRSAGITLMWCGGGEPDIYAALREVITVERSGTRLRLLRDDGSELGTLVPDRARPS